MSSVNGKIYSSSEVFLPTFICLSQIFWHSEVCFCTLFFFRHVHLNTMFIYSVVQFTFVATEFIKVSINDYVCVWTLLFFSLISELHFKSTVKTEFSI